MAVSIEKGKVYTAKMVRSGVSNRGDWEMVKVVDGHKEITIWPDNKPSGVEEGQEFEVVEITGIKYGSRKRNDQWRDDVSATAIIKPSKTSAPLFTIDDVDEGELPWTMGDSPFSISDDDKLPL